MADNEKTVFPRIPERNWWALRDQFAKTLPREVTIGYLKSLLQLDTEKSAQNLIPPLKQLGLIDDDGKPTELANDWRNDAKYAQACEKMLELYPHELRELYGDSSADKKAVENWFQYSGKLGQGTAKISASFYLLLLDATPKSSADFAKPQPTKKPGGKKPEKVDPPKPVPEPSAMPLDTKPFGSPEQVLQDDAIAQEKGDNWFSLHIDLQIHISPDASAEQIDQIFASMAKHIMSMKQTDHDGREAN